VLTVFTELITREHSGMSNFNINAFKNSDYFDVCVTVQHIWKWRELPTWCNNCDLLS